MHSESRAAVAPSTFALLMAGLLPVVACGAPSPSSGVESTSQAISGQTRVYDCYQQSIGTETATLQVGVGGASTYMTVGQTQYGPFVYSGDSNDPVIGPSANYVDTGTTLTIPQNTQYGGGAANFFADSPGGLISVESTCTSSPVFCVTLKTFYACVFSDTQSTVPPIPGK